MILQQPQYFITDNSAAKQYTVILVFDIQIKHFLCQTHFKQTFI